MSFYENHILPHITDKTCSLGQIMKLPSQVVSHTRAVPQYLCDAFGAGSFIQA